MHGVLCLVYKYVQLWEMLSVITCIKLYVKLVLFLILKNIYWIKFEGIKKHAGIASLHIPLPGDRIGCTHIHTWMHARTHKHN